MPEFLYVAIDRIGRNVAGTIQADNSAIAAGRIREMGYTVERVRAIESHRRAEGIGRRFVESCVLPVTCRVPIGDVAVFFRILGIMMRSRLSFHDALIHMERQTRNWNLKGILRDAHQHVAAGGRLSDVLAAYPWVFSETQVEMVRTAEHTGRLDRMLDVLTGHMDRLVHLRTLILPLALVPFLLFEACLLVLGRSFFTTGIPAMSLFILGRYPSLMNFLSDTVVFALGVSLVALVVITLGRVTIYSWPPARAGYDSVKSGNSRLSRVLAALTLARFERAFATAFAAGLPLGGAIRSAGRASGSSLYESAAQRANECCERGVSLSEAFSQTRAFSPEFLALLHTGQTTGNVDDLLLHHARGVEDEAIFTAQKLAWMTTLAVGYGLAILVGFGIIMAR